MNKKLIVLSVDAMQSDDLEKLLKMPYMAKLKDEFAIVKSLREIYPTLTYPIHTSIVTGVTPSKHGIFHNQKPQVQPKDPDWSLMGSDWFWEYENIKAKTLQDYCNDKNLTVATVGWPVTANDKRGINIPEIWPSKGSDSEVASKLFARTSSKLAYYNYFDKFIKYFSWKDNEDLSLYNCEMMLDIIERFKPDVLLGHILHFDHTRHVYGVNSPQISDCIRQIDILLYRFITLIKKNYDMTKTSIVILSDHGQLDIERHVYLNKLFEEAGLIRFVGEEVEYDAFSFSAGFSTQIYLKETNSEIENKVLSILKQALIDYPEYLEKLYVKEEVESQEGLAGPFSFVLEGTPGTQFRNELKAKSIVVDNHDNYRCIGMHGHHPAKGLKPCLLAMGGDIAKGKVIENANILDVFPTLMRALELDYSPVDGKELEIFKL